MSLLKDTYGDMEGLVALGHAEKVVLPDGSVRYRFLGKPQDERDPKVVELMRLQDTDEEHQP